eukprot:SAG22_NODE_1288_length_4868_cov_5.920109_1_plen_374_part_00
MTIFKGMAAAAGGVADFASAAAGDFATAARSSSAKLDGRQLRKMAWKGDVEAARQLVQRRAAVEQRDADGFTALLVAARWGRAEVVRMLVEEHGADPAVQNLDRHNALDLARVNGHAAVAAYLAGAMGLAAEPAAADPAATAGGGQPAGSGGGEDERRTVWVGGIPDELAAAEGAETTLSGLFSQFGEVATVAIRKKAAGGGGSGDKSWALVSFASEAAATAAVAAAAVATPSTRRMESSELTVRAAAVSARLSQGDQAGAGGGHGALAAVWDKRTPVQQQMDRIQTEVTAAYAARREAQAAGCGQGAPAGAPQAAGGGGGGGGGGILLPSSTCQLASCCARPIAAPAPLLRPPHCCAHPIAAPAPGCSWLAG